MYNSVQRTQNQSYKSKNISTILIYKVKKNQLWWKNYLETNIHIHLIIYFLIYGSFKSFINNIF